ncbi:MAG: ASKHA domain-containing protein [Lachnospiraceae bacterium]|nr:ASKHA domain-containing protein [Lachnospiraceae bacterium]MDD5853957.1 ASKHA domain-containing protein [Lachnospiraceae bacterium]
MSELQLVIKTENETSESKLFFESGESLLLLCQKAGIPVAANCGGKGICGKCKVRFLKGAPLPTAQERRFFSPDELRQGYRLACLSRLYTDCEIEVPKLRKVDAVSKALDIKWKPIDRYDGKYFITTDIGTTTLVMQKVSASDGQVIETYKAVNAQNRFGSDVISRLEASEHGHREELSHIIRDQLCQGVEKLGSDDVLFMVIAANTTMVHLLMEYDVQGLSKAPFDAVCLDEVRTEIAGIETYVMPGYSAFVGGDIFSGVLAICSTTNNSPTLLIDLGTNAEMVLFDSDRMVATSAAAGSAFDSIAGVGLFGADVVAILYRLLKEHRIDCHGTLQDEWFEQGVAIEYKKQVYITQDHIRQMQLAKAAVRCGIDYLSEAFGCALQEIGQVYVAGGFGYYLDVEAAFGVGLLPDAFRGKTFACGNTALSGARVYGYDKLVAKDSGNGKGNDKLFSNVFDFPKKKIINLAMEPDFSERYISYLDFSSDYEI